MTDTDSRLMMIRLTEAKAGVTHAPRTALERADARLRTAEADLRCPFPMTTTMRTALAMDLRGETLPAWAKAECDSYARQMAEHVRHTRGVREVSPVAGTIRLEGR